MLRILYIFVQFNLIILIECKMEPYIVGGEYAKISNFPHSALLNVLCHEDFDEFVPWICGSSIINDKILLTAAHCVSGCGRKSRITAGVGHVHLDRGLNLKCTSFVMHDKYDSNKVAYDLAIVKLANKLTYNNNVKRIALMPNPPYYEEAQVAGWGLINEIREKTGNNLMFIKQYVWQSERCKEIIHSLPRGAICASSGKTDSYSSRGDSGSALLVRGYIQIGLVSYKMPSASRSLVVYMDTGYFYDWITTTSKKLYCAK